MQLVEMFVCSDCEDFGAVYIEGDVLSVKKCKCVSEDQTGAGVAEIKCRNPCSQ